jgi:ABC-type transport system involved in multi-copper enzyme maturation permease subunit
VIAALRYEWVRVSTVRSTKLLLGFVLVLSTLLAWLIANPQQALDDQGNQVGLSPVDWWGAFGGPLPLTAVFASVVAAQAIGQEYRFGLIRLTLTAFPDRVQILVAKLVVVVVAAAVLTLVSFVGSELGVTLRGHPLPAVDSPPADGTFLLRGTVFVVLWALSAFALAGVTRQTAIGIAVPIVSGLVVEQLLMALLSDRIGWLVHNLPWTSGGRWGDDVRTAGRGAVLGQELSVGWAAVGVFAVWVAAFLAVEVVAFLRRDA